METTESSLEKLIRLATVNVREYERFERGKNQVVRPHTETRAEAAKVAGWIPEPKWQAGQQEWEQKGEAAWKAKGAQAKAKDAQEDDLDRQIDQNNRAEWNRLNQEDYAKQKAGSAPADWASSGGAPTGSDKAADAKAAAERTGGVRPAADRRTHVPSSPRARARAERMAARSGSLQSRVEKLEEGRQAAAARVANHPLFKQPAAEQTQAQQVIDTAAESAMDGALLHSGQISKNELASVKAEMAAMEARLATMAETRASERAAAVHKAVEHSVMEKERALFALNLLGIVAGVLLIAFTSGVGAMIGELMAFKWTTELAKELVAYHGIAKHQAVRDLMGHPLKKGAVPVAKVGAKAAVKTVKTVKSVGSPRRKTG